MIKIIALLIGFAVSVFVAAHAATFFEEDSCLDAGGKIESETGACSLNRDGSYVPLLSRPDLYAFWTLFTFIMLTPGCASAWILQKVLTRARDRFGSTKLDGSVGSI